ncbi:MAG TPA: flagellar hook-basal body complex protein FliE [Galbitalea sp.]
MTIAAISSVPNIAQASAVTPAASAGGGSSFATSLVDALNSVQSTQASSDQLAVQAVTGNLDDIHAATIAATRAQVTVQLVSAVRNQGVDAFKTIMNMSA